MNTFEERRAKAEAGDLAAIKEIAKISERSLKTVEETEEALRWYKKLEELEPEGDAKDFVRRKVIWLCYVKSLFYTNYMYENGYNSENDDYEDVLLKQGKETIEKDGLKSLAFEELAKYAKPLVSKNDAYGIYMFSYYLRDIGQMEAELKYLERAAELGERLACERLYEKYKNGEGVKKNPFKASHYKKLEKKLSCNG